MEVKKLILNEWKPRNGSGGVNDGKNEPIFKSVMFLKIVYPSIHSSVCCCRLLSVFKMYEMLLPLLPWGEILFFSLYIFHKLCKIMFDEDIPT